MSTIDLRALFHIGYGLYIVAAQSGGRLNGQIVNTVFQVSAEPPRIAVAIHKNNLTHQLISESGAFSVSVLDTDTPMPFIGTFGFKSGHDVQKFDGVEYKIGVTGSPIVLAHTLSAMEAKLFGKMDLGTHDLFVADLVAAECLREGQPLTYSYYRENKHGKAPQNAPTYQARPAKNR